MSVLTRGLVELSAQEQSYKQKIDTSIRDVLLEFECQPILFIGSGLPRRYFSAPGWLDLLREVHSRIPGEEGKFEYYRQKFESDPIEIGTQLADIAFEWAWSAGREYFPEEFFRPGVGKDCFIKYMCCQFLGEITPDIPEISENFRKEIEALATIRPHAIITTNYDMFLEKIFEGYYPVTGQTILRYNTNSFGEIFHIHGDISSPSSIVLTNKDYQEWAEKKKYISAKLLTYFAEHPVFIFGYSMGDPNVKSILGDIGELVADERGVISNVYQVIWTNEVIEKHPPEQAVFSLDGREYRVNSIYANDFQWIFEALKSRSALTSVNPELVRALAARTMRLIRHDIPSGKVNVNYDVLERVAQQDDALPNLLGISLAENPNQTHPLTITQVATRLGFNHWHPANVILNKIKADKGIDLRSTDNRYHCQIKTGPGKNSKVRKWSLEAVDLFMRVKNKEEYTIDI